MTNCILEACIQSPLEAKHAEENGASQLEICTRLDLDGLTPSLELTKNILDNATIPCKIILNPKAYDYSYTKSELEHLVARLSDYPIKSLQGIVFGALTIDKLPDLKALEYIKKNIDLPITFHKAIDISSDILLSTEILQSSEIVDFILSSGGMASALVGIDMLSQMEDILENSKTKLIAAGKITPVVLPSLTKKLKTKHYHGRRIVG